MSRPSQTEITAPALIHELRKFTLLGSSHSALCVALVLCRQCPRRRLIHLLGSLCTTTTCRSRSRGVSGLDAILAPLGGRSIHDRASEPPRILLPLSWVNKGCPNASRIHRGAFPDGFSTSTLAIGLHRKPHLSRLLECP